MYHEFIKDLRSICNERRIRLRNIGYAGKKKKYPLFSLTLKNNHKQRKTICFLAGMHGDEPAGPLAIKKFIGEFDAKRLEDVKVIMFPVANPYGFERQTRRNHIRRSANGHFCDRRLYNEDKIIYDQLKNKRLFFFHDLHEDADETRFYLYNYERKEEKIYRDIIKLAGRYTDINRNRMIYGDASNGGLVANVKDGSIEDRLFRDGVPYTLTTETPGKKPLPERVKINTKIMNLILGFSISHKQD